MFKLFGKLFHGSSKHNGVSDHHYNGKDGSRRARLTTSHHAGASDKKMLLPHGRARAATYHTHPDTPVSYYPVGLGSSARPGGNLATQTGVVYYPYHSTRQPRPSALSGDRISAVTVSGVVPLTEENLQLHLSLNPPVKESKYERVLRYVMEQRKYALLDEEAEALPPLVNAEAAEPKVEANEPSSQQPVTKQTSGLAPLCSKVGLKPLPVHKLRKRSSATPLVNTPPLQDAAGHGDELSILGPVVRSSSQPHRKTSPLCAPLSPQAVATSEPPHSSPSIPDLDPQNKGTEPLEVTPAPQGKDSAVMINDGGDELPNYIRHSTEPAVRLPPTPRLPPLDIPVETSDPVKVADPQQDASEPSSPTAEVIHQGPDHPSLSPAAIKFRCDGRPEIHPKGGCVAPVVSPAPKSSLSKKDKMTARGVVPTTRHRKSNSVSAGFNALKRILRV
ncbi:hypothetical protein IWQ62_005725 [Dispira parvispora]|uniref:Uncharacterized protein n=1 Tax=Dispira parvispora TaxID=1520584 RepID=A0A9W8AQF8_9FUNG|nr:hypothetical protein IWQ62_005725 [Dispira parvispora]